MNSSIQKMNDWIGYPLDMLYLNNFKQLPNHYS